MYWILKVNALSRTHINQNTFINGSKYTKIVIKIKFNLNSRAKVFS